MHSKNILSQQEEQNSDNSSRRSTPPSMYNIIPLPISDFSKFCGKYEYIIHENQKTSGNQKFQSLKSSFLEDAINNPQDLGTSIENYQIACQLLNKSYNNPLLLARSHIQRNFELPSLVKESLAILRQVMDGLRRNMQELETLEHPISQKDGLIVYFISNKLDPVTRREWESTVSKDQQKF